MRTLEEMEARLDEESEKRIQAGREQMEREYAQKEREFTIQKGINGKREKGQNYV